MTTPREREDRRRTWVGRVAREIPKEHRTPAVLASLDRLVYVDTWSPSGLSFEFAHFSDRQIAVAMQAVDRRARRPTLARRIEQVKSCRARRGNLRELMPRTSKLDLADALWPILREKLKRAEARGTDKRIPIVRILDRAVHLATELRGVNVVLER
ncbi:MAG: hypothetical protein M3320_00125 [Actinomycetota bacterium]|nr:hypothetical protein [Actinomycetota bacterium]MDQ5807062.1 hypothetical protein [Actinomycetota bacterium]